MTRTHSDPKSATKTSIIAAVVGVLSAVGGSGITIGLREPGGTQMCHDIQQTNRVLQELREDLREVRVSVRSHLEQHAKLALSLQQRRGQTDE